MIVKDEAHVIERCLTSVQPFIDTWTIVDTGSSDGTQQLVAKLLEGIPGQLVERPWQDFAHNRTESLALARPLADYSLIIDADEVFEVPVGFAWPELTAEVYAMHHVAGATTFWVERMVANRLPWRYVGVLHEYLDCPGVADRGQLAGPCIVGHYDGGRSQGITQVEKYARDARTLERALQDEPDNKRYQYYLARSYRDSEQWEAALAAFAKRATMGGFAEEVFDSLQAVGRIKDRLGADPSAVIAAFLAAYESRPTRAEPLCSLAQYLRRHKRFELARLFAARAAEIPQPPDILFVDEGVYRWRSDDELAVASYWTGRYAESASLCRELLDSGDLPDSERSRVENNLEFAETKLREQQPPQPAGTADL
jgi:hypothetical protein